MIEPAGVYRVICDKCSNLLMQLNGSSMFIANVDGAAELAEEQGWSIKGRYATCDACVQKNDS